MPAFRPSAQRRRRRPSLWLGRGAVLLLTIWVGLGVGALRVPPRVWWPTAFIGLTLPAALGLLSLLLGGLALQRRWRRTLLPALVLLVAGSYVQRGVALRLPVTSQPPVARAPNRQLRVLSYNVRIFNTYAALRDTAATRRHLNWLAAHPADVQCLQEYYNQKDRAGHPAQLFGATRKLLRGRYGFVSKSLENPTQQFGMAVFSRYPLLKRGTLAFGHLTQNHAMWVDVRLPGPAASPTAYDTMRVYNVHFQSMALDEEAIVQTTRRRAWLDPPGLHLLRRFRNGAVRRSRQVDTLVAHLRTCPYPVVVCGDFNDVPYSYTYERLARLLTNAHQAAGAGVGSTYHGRLPLLRIDNQFCSPLLQPVWARVLREIPYSDHFPLDAVYQYQGETTRGKAARRAEAAGQ